MAAVMIPGVERKNRAATGRILGVVIQHEADWLALIEELPTG